MQKTLLQIFFSFVLLQTSLLSNDIDIDKIVQDSYKNNKKVFLYLHRVGCGYCNSMEEFTLEDDDVKRYIKENYRLIDINVSYKDYFIYKGERKLGHTLVKELGYAFYPSALFLNKKGDIAYPAVGYKNEYEFLVILRYFKENIYQKESLSEYKKQIGFSKKNFDDEIEDKREHAR
jgi:thioredoxin-related protein